MPTSKLIKPQMMLMMRIPSLLFGFPLIEIQNNPPLPNKPAINDMKPKQVKKMLSKENITRKSHILSKF